MKTISNKKTEIEKTSFNYKSYNDIIEKKLTRSEDLLKDADLSLLYNLKKSQKI